jgi:transposase
VLVPHDSGRLHQVVVEDLQVRLLARPGDGGRPRVDDRAALTGIVFVLKIGIPWEMLPQEMGCGSGMTCWRRLKEWQEAGVWERLHRVLLDRLGEAEQIEWERASLDSASIPAKRVLSHEVAYLFRELERTDRVKG